MREGRGCGSGKEGSGVCDEYGCMRNGCVGGPEAKAEVAELGVEKDEVGIRIVVEMVGGERGEEVGAARLFDKRTTLYDCQSLGW